MRNCSGCVHWKLIETKVIDHNIGHCAIINGVTRGDYGCDSWLGYKETTRQERSNVSLRCGDTFDPHFAIEESHRQIDTDHIMRDVTMNQVADEMEKSIAALKETAFSLFDFSFKMAETQFKLRQAKEAEKAARCKCWWCRIKFRIMDKIHDLAESGVLDVK